MGTTTQVFPEQERRWAEAVERYRARFGLDGPAVLDAKVRDREHVAALGIDARSRANARRWLREHGVL